MKRLSSRRDQYVVTARRNGNARALLADRAKIAAVDYDSSLGRRVHDDEHPLSQAL
ncbi:hypothetical protein [Brevundimonas sp. SL130]|uniref:hypothetical protein n=1 Tax=Brevundimonas sp. SL130 TaxID=2995143 RepID=UPI00226D3FAE|nr:hypothetical protein [Brevundimonas sp. SL130]WAC61350.1 hypothetical protein OU998_07895 [Brevundimonas sp. SL130]